MALEEPPEDDSLCGAELDSKPGKFCENQASQDDGYCGFHSDHVEHHGMGGEWKHGANAKRSNYYKKLPDEEKEWLHGLYFSFLEDAPFDEESRGKAEMLWDVCVDIHKKRRLNDYIEAKGVVQEKFVGAGESGPYYEDDENVVHLTYDRLSRSTIKVLKELGVLDDPQSKQAEAHRSFVDILSSEFSE